MTYLEYPKFTIIKRLSIVLMILLSQSASSSTVSCGGTKEFCQLYNLYYKDYLFKSGYLILKPSSTDIESYFGRKVAKYGFKRASTDPVIKQYMLSHLLYSKGFVFENTWPNSIVFKDGNGKTVLYRKQTNCFNVKHCIITDSEIPMTDYSGSASMVRVNLPLYTLR